jgi:soluble P-type ATPase
VEGYTVSVGNAAFTGTDTALTDLGRDTAVCVSVDSVPVAVIAVGDVIREGARDAVSSIRESGADCVMLTGDSESAASAVAAEVGIDHHISGCRPEDKLASIGKMKDEGRVVCMIGDGINDAPSLKAADVGIAMGGTGSGMAIDVSDMVIVGDELGKIPYLRYLTGKMLSRIKLNITFGMCWNFMAVALAVTGTVGAVEGAIIHNVGSVAVVLSSFLLLFAGFLNTLFPLFLGRFLLLLGTSLPLGFLLLLDSGFLGFLRFFYRCKEAYLAVIFHLHAEVQKLGSAAGQAIFRLLKLLLTHRDNTLILLPEVFIGGHAL